MTNGRLHLEETGWALVSSGLEPSVLEDLRQSLFHKEAAGKRCLLDEPLVRQTARVLGQKLMAQKILTRTIAIQAIAFNKTAAKNWKVAWHQDLMFPFAKPVTTPGFDLPVKKEGIDYARPPAEILGRLLAVRLHLDDCGKNNGPLRISSGSHQYGIIPGHEVSTYVERLGESVCTATCGEMLLMRPLALHASSPALTPGHRRVLHFVYDSGLDCLEPWHRTIA